MPEAEARLRMMGWLIAGIEISNDHPKARRQHVFETEPRDIPPMGEAELERIAREYWAAGGAG